VDRLFDKLGLDYATCMFGVLDLEASTFRWSNAGHPPPLLLRAGAATFLTESSGVLLGVTAGAGMTEATTGLRDGDFLVLYTDGLVERRNESLQAGLDRLAAAAARSGADDADVLCEHLLEALVPASATRDDDVAILVARVGSQRPAPGVHRLEFEPAPSSAALTRGFTAGVLEGAGWREQVDTAVLLVSELVTNSVRHARGPCALQVSFDDDTVEFCVEDGDPTVPVARIAQGLDESGRGFLLVGALADRWGVRAMPDGKATWFTLSRSSPEE
jgi:anti-sigma regulatory factor (Ser/Thr protein kinase)